MQFRDELLLYVESRHRGRAEGPLVEVGGVVFCHKRGDDVTMTSSCQSDSFLRSAITLQAHTTNRSWQNRSPLIPQFHVPWAPLEK